jgi:hypothetical protein
MKQASLSDANLKTRQSMANSVIMNAKEIASPGLHGSMTKKVIALVPLSLIMIDHKAYQRSEGRHISKMIREWDDEKCTLLLVNYRSKEGYFYVIDGQHRTRAARLLGIKYLACEIFIDLSVQEEAKRFLSYNTGTQSLTPFDTFKANVCLGETDDMAIKSVCDSYGIAIIDRKDKAKPLRSVTAVRAIYRNGGTFALHWVFTLIENTFWTQFKQSYSADILLGLNSVYLKYKGDDKELATAQDNLIKFMRNSSPTEIIGLASAEYPTLGHTTRVRLICEEIAKGNSRKVSHNTDRVIKVI